MSNASLPSSLFFELLELPPALLELVDLSPPRATGVYTVKGASPPY